MRDTVLNSIVHCPIDTFYGSDSDIEHEAEEQYLFSGNDVIGATVDRHLDHHSWRDYHQKRK
jgi:hypothetical protein